MPSSERKSETISLKQCRAHVRYVTGVSPPCRIQRYHSTLKQLDAELSSGPGTAGASKLERAWKGDAEALRLQLQKHREGAVSRYGCSRQIRQHQDCIPNRTQGLEPRIFAASCRDVSPHLSVVGLGSVIAPRSWREWSPQAKSLLCNRPVHERLCTFRGSKLGNALARLFVCLCVSGS